MNQPTPFRQGHRCGLIDHHGHRTQPFSKPQCHAWLDSCVARALVNSRNPPGSTPRSVQPSRLTGRQQGWCLAPQRRRDQPQGIGWSGFLMVSPGRRGELMPGARSGQRHSRDGDALHDAPGRVVVVDRVVPRGDVVPDRYRVRLAAVCPDPIPAVWVIAPASPHLMFGRYHWEHANVRPEVREPARCLAKLYSQEHHRCRRPQSARSLAAAS